MENPVIADGPLVISIIGRKKRTYFLYVILLESSFKESGTFVAGKLIQ